MSFDELKSRVIDSGLCEGCGLCAGFCKAITLENRVPVLSGTCTLSKGARYCGQCMDLCPQAHPEHITVEMLRPLRAVALRSTDQSLLESASNGGFVTTLLGLLLEEGHIRAVTAVTGDTRNPVPVTVTSREDIVRLSGTRYSPSGVLNEFAAGLRSHGRNVAVVGLPCEIRGVHRLERNLGISILKIGLFCSNNNRDTQDGKTEVMECCRHCTDFFNSNADISCGFAGAPKGYTTVISRTSQGDELFTRAISSGRFEVTDTDLSKVKAAQSRKSSRVVVTELKTLRDRILQELAESGPVEIDDLSGRLDLQPSDIIYHLLVLWNAGQVRVIEDRENPYRVMWGPPGSGPGTQR
ncbi:MAG: Coenzyme F420 hydrogenase/dehydrogenase, beta subunit C-terminal domain [Candidatus Thorarchaeota archaeon]